MKTEIRTFLIDTCFWVISISIIFFFFILILYSHNNINDPLKESFSLTISLFSALATLGAAIIAARLFQNWKTQHSFTEQIKILSQMLMSIDEIHNALWEARTNDTLTKILMGQPYEQKINICFEEQYEKFGEVSRKLMSLYKLENQIYLFNNTAEKHPIFKNQSGEENNKEINNIKTSPLNEILNFIAHTQIAVMIFQSHLTEKQEELALSHKEGEPEALLSFKTVDFTESYLSEYLMNLLSRAGMYLSLVYPSKYPEHERKNPANIKLNRSFKALEQQVKAYRDKLEALD